MFPLHPLPVSSNYVPSDRAPPGPGNPLLSNSAAWPPATATSQAHAVEGPGATSYQQQIQQPRCNPLWGLQMGISMSSVDRLSAEHLAWAMVPPTWHLQHNFVFTDKNHAIHHYGGSSLERNWFSSQLLGHGESGAEHGSGSILQRVFHLLPEQPSWLGDTPSPVPWDHTPALLDFFVSHAQNKKSM